MKTTFKSAELKMSILSNVHTCWLAMPLGAGVLRWVLAHRTIEKTNKSLICTPRIHTSMSALKVCFVCATAMQLQLC